MQNSVENCETDVFERTGRCPEARNHKLQSNYVDIGDVKVVRNMNSPALGERKSARKVEETAYWRFARDKLPALASVGYALAAKNTGNVHKKGIP